MSISGIEQFLNAPLKKYNKREKEVHSIICWGFKKTSQKAEKIATKYGHKLVRLEDGFITQIPGVDFKASICMDQDGMHYSADSRLHELIKRDLTEKEVIRSKALINYKNQNFISKYNQQPVLEVNNITKTGTNYVLIVDQVSDDESIKHSNGSFEMFKQMIADAKRDNPDSTILIAKHPDDKNKVPFTKLLTDDEINPLDPEGQVHLINNPVNILQLVCQVDKVYTISSLLGFEACLYGKETHVYGSPFYSGYGFTEDVNAPFKADVSILNVFHAAYVDYCSYVNPFTMKQCELEDVMELVAANIAYYPATQLVVKKPSMWKRKFLSKYLSKYSLLPTEFNDKFYNTEWGYDAENPEITMHIEDGFIRSCGLGSSLVLPNSLSIDKGGIYYDFKSNSDLSVILNTHIFTHRELERAEAVIDFLRENKISKYNISREKPNLPTQQFVLVPGQVETDKSLIASGCGYKNADSVRIARERYPEHLIVYRPHPDVFYNKVANQDESLAMDMADLTSIDGDIIHWIENASAVVTITSNSGFEAILRDIPVYCLGYPYYFGYGLTIDETPLPNRTRKLDIFMLVAGVLLKYPEYYDNEKQAFCRIEEVLSIIKNTTAPKNISANFMTRVAYKAKYLIKP